MTQKEYQEKRAQNLCFYCDQKYTASHKYSGQLYSIVHLADEELDSDEEYMEEESSMPEEQVGCRTNKTYPLEVAVGGGRKLISNAMYKKMTLRGTPKVAIQWLEGKNQDKEFESTANAELLMLCVYSNTGVNLINMEGQTKEGEIGSELSLVVDTFADVL
ncbi:hypothetical protein Tco_1280734 [Tanacetum coccineum]